MGNQLDKPQVIAACIDAQRNKEEITEDVARWIAGYFRPHPGSALHLFSWTGLYDQEIVGIELSEIILHHYYTKSSDDRLMMDMLGTYIRNRKV